VGTSSATQTITLANSGLAPLHIAGITLTGANTGAFLISSDGCAGATVAPGSSCSIGVDFLPAAAGSLSASLVILDNARTSPQTVLLSGTGVVPPTNTPVPPTSTPVPPTSTPMPPTGTPAPVPPTGTPVPPAGTARPASMPPPP